MAAQGATEKVTKLAEHDDELVTTLERMQTRPWRPQSAATRLAGDFEGKKTAILDEARQVKQKATEMMQTYLDRDADALDGFEFLTMAEAGEVGHWEILKTLTELSTQLWRAGARRVGHPDPATPPRAGPAGFPEACSGGRPEPACGGAGGPCHLRSASPAVGAARKQRARSATQAACGDLLSALASRSDEWSRPLAPAAPTAGH